MYYVYLFLFYLCSAIIFNTTCNNIKLHPKTYDFSSFGCNYISGKNHYQLYKVEYLGYQNCFLTLWAITVWLVPGTFVCNNVGDKGTLQIFLQCLRSNGAYIWSVFIRFEEKNHWGTGICCIVHATMPP